MKTITTKFQLPTLFISGRFIVGEAKNKTKTKINEISLASIRFIDLSFVKCFNPELVLLIILKYNLMPNNAISACLLLLQYHCRGIVT